METGTGTREGEQPGNGARDASPADAKQDKPGYLGFVAHEVRNPLSTALWTAELLVRMSAADRAGARGDKLSAMCLRSLGRLRQLVEDHFLCERLDVDGIPLRIEPIGVREAISAAVEHRPAGAGQVAVEAAEELLVNADRMLLERAIDALVAVEGRDGTPVRVVARADGGSIALVVTGMPADAAAMQDPVKGSASDPSGRALALPVARRIAATLHGSLAIAADGYVLSLPQGTYIARPDPAAHP